MAETCYRLALGYSDSQGPNKRAVAALLRVEGARERSGKSGGIKLSEDETDARKVLQNRSLLSLMMDEHLRKHDME